MGKSKAIIPKQLPSDRQRMSRVIVNTMNMAAKAIKVDFEVTTQTWSHEVDFAITSPRPYVRQVATDDPIYSMLNEGTRPHIITPHRSKVLRFTGPFRAKTRPGYIGSSQGGTGSAETFTRVVHHPGTAPRQWSKAIKEKWQKLFPAQLQRAIDSEY